MKSAKVRSKIQFLVALRIKDLASQASAMAGYVTPSAWHHINIKYCSFLQCSIKLEISIPLYCCRKKGKGQKTVLLLASDAVQLIYHHHTI